jgi:hypothetical protein
LLLRWLCRVRRAPSAPSRRPATKKAALVGIPAGGVDLRFVNGPLAAVGVEDGKVLAFCVGGLLLDNPRIRDRLRTFPSSTPTASTTAKPS